MLNTTNSEATVQAFINWAVAQPDEACRRWSYEIETVSIREVADKLNNLGFATHHDASVQDEYGNEAECECDCEDCQHSCDCNNCSIADYDQDHCGNCQSTEAAPSDHKPVLTTKDGERLAKASWLLADADVNDTTGNHVHVNADDLTAKQIAQVMKIWHRVQTLLMPLIGRSYCNYAKEIGAYEIETTEGGRTSDRYLSVNPQGAINNIERLAMGYGRGHKTTIEFRQFAGTTDAGLIIARGYLARALVEYARKDIAPYWLNRCETAEQLLNELGLMR